MKESYWNLIVFFFSFQWNISDYFYQNRSRITEDLTESEAESEQTSKTPLPPFDRLWMCLYTKLGELCVDTRPAVRKSAGQTLFSTIAAHGSLLQQQTWQTVLWQVGLA